MLKKVVASLDDVEEKYRGLYTEQADGTFKLDVMIEGSDNLEGLKTNNYELKKEKLALQAKLQELLDKDGSRQEQDLLDQKKYEELLASKEKTWAEKETATTARLQALETRLRETALSSALKSLAVELAGDRSLLIEPHLKSRLDVVEENGEFKVVVKDAAGAVSTLTTAQLAEEFRNTEIFAPILKGRNSSGGGGGSEGDGASGPASLAQYEKYFNPKGKDYSPTRQRELQDKNKAMHDELVKKYNLNSLSAYTN